MVSLANHGRFLQPSYNEDGGCTEGDSGGGGGGGGGGCGGSEFPAVPPMPSNYDNWTYSMRRSMQEIVPRLYLGPYSAAMKASLAQLIAAGITHIVCVRHSLESQFIRPNFQDRFVYLILEIADSCVENIICHFACVRRFIDDTLDKGGKVLVHGNAGISRSAALVLAYIMQKYGLTLREAYNVVQQRRFCINPNDGFMAQLREFEPIYMAQHKAVLDGQTSASATINATSSHNKRTSDQIEDTS